MPYQVCGVELGLDDEIGHAVRQRRNDAVAGAGDPARIGGAPEDVVVMQVERIEPGGMMGHDRLVDVDRAFRPAGRAAGEMQQRHVLGRRSAGSRSRRRRPPSAARQRTVPATGGPSSIRITCASFGSRPRSASTLRR